MYTTTRGCTLKPSVITEKFLITPGYKTVLIKEKICFRYYFMASLHLGDYIRRKREELKISQEAVAFELNMSQAAYSKIERNETKLKVEQVYTIANYFGLSVYELLPPSLASDITGENIFGLAWQYLKIFFRKVFSSVQKGKSLT